MSVTFCNEFIKSAVNPVFQLSCRWIKKPNSSMLIVPVTQILRSSIQLPVELAWSIFSVDRSCNTKIIVICRNGRLLILMLLQLRNVTSSRSKHLPLIFQKCLTMWPSISEETNQERYKLKNWQKRPEELVSTIGWTVWMNLVFIIVMDPTLLVKASSWFRYLCIFCTGMFEVEKARKTSSLG